MCSVKGWPTVTLEGFAARVGCTVELGGGPGATGTTGAGSAGAGVTVRTAFMVLDLCVVVAS